MSTAAEADWLAVVREVDDGHEYLRKKAEEGSERRAFAIASAVAALGRGRGGREAVAEQLGGVSVRTVDKAIARAKQGRPYSSLPVDLAERLLALELADLDPLPADWWTAIAHLARGTVADGTWLDDPAERLAALLEDVARTRGSRVALGPITAAVRTFNRPQTLAVLEAIRQNAIESLPTRR
ncbi:hypothetical protein ACFWXO_05440 [Kitasatospora sp. NPDC059088]|uniref:hypothetical protein n=1 Tax=Kitasatospora sp. NPDC059088 TaxID=3346722 RepID=UPI0036B3845A